MCMVLTFLITCSKTCRTQVTSFLKNLPKVAVEGNINFVCLASLKACSYNFITHLNVSPAKNKRMSRQEYK